MGKRADRYGRWFDDIDQLIAAGRYPGAVTMAGSIIEARLQAVARKIGLDLGDREGATRVAGRLAGARQEEPALRAAFPPAAPDKDETRRPLAERGRRRGYPADRIEHAPSPLLDELRTWLEHRNALTHRTFAQDEAAVNEKTVAEAGRRLARELTAAALRLDRILDRGDGSGGGQTAES